jgi:hypothetical protein
MASDGDVAKIPCVCNGTNRYSTAVLIAELVGKYFVLEVRKGKIMTFRFIIENI